MMKESLLYKMTQFGYKKDVTLDHNRFSHVFTSKYVTLLLRHSFLATQLTPLARLVLLSIVYLQVRKLFPGALVCAHAVLTYVFVTLAPRTLHLRSCPF
jgi:hypothetical protein